MRIAVIHANDGSDVRIGKTCRSLSAMGHDVHFIGWDRRGDPDRRIDLGRTTLHVMKHPTRHGRSTPKGQCLFWWHVVRSLGRIRPRVVCCVNEDSCLGVLPLRGLLYDRLVCDVFDALVDRHSRRSWSVRCVLRMVSELVRACADRLIATDEGRFNRFGRHRRKTIVVENVPEDPGAEISRTLPAGAIRIYVAGSLSLDRGLAQIVEVAERLGNVEIVSAGWPYDEYAGSTFVTHPRVSFRGVVTARESLELAAGCDAVLAFYAPTSVNNLHASPNKIYDAMSVGRPVIVNSEIRPARWVETNRLGWTCPFADVGALEGIVARLADRRSDLPAFAARARAMYLAGCTWARMEDRLARLYRELEAPESRAQGR